ncbi:MAG: hypothetical protein AAF688_12605 [Bacteroidota bacterium]
MATHIKCPNCGTFNTNREFCRNCGTLLSSKKRRELAFKKEETERQERRRIKEEANPSFYDKYKDHRYWVVRVFATVTHYIALAFIAIGTFIAWLVTAIAA